jgi:UDP-N-acetylmuramoylalanine--D-glutamate ligase
MNFTEKLNKLGGLFKNKKVAILGFGKEGISTYHFIKKYFPETWLIISDINDSLVEKHPFLNKSLNTEIITGNNYLEVLNSADLIIKSPGISLKDSRFDKYEEKITNQTDLFLRLFSEQVIGITGTKGKSTTSSLLHHILQKNSIDSILVGNIGLPPFEIIENIEQDTFIVFEMSSHQLQNIGISPHISVLLNIFEEHLDHYNSFREYIKAKIDIAYYQNEKDFFIYNYDNLLLKSTIDKIGIKSKIFEYGLNKIDGDGIYIENSKIFSKNQNTIIEKGDTNFSRNIPGNHNLSNILAAIKVCEIIGLEYNKVINAISDFKSLEHRLEFVGTFNEISFYNDSISTIPEATIAALETIEKVDTLILGGFDRGINYESLAYYLVNSQVNNFIFLGEAGKRIHNEILKNGKEINKHFFFAENMYEVVELAFKITSKNASCLLSPAASSYDLFKNFEHRGNIFKETVLNYNKKSTH